MSESVSRSENIHSRRRGVTYATTRPIKPEEKEVMTIAAEIVRRRYHDDVSEELDELMQRWAMRLKAAYDDIVEPIRIRRGDDPIEGQDFDFGRTWGV